MVYSHLLDGQQFHCPACSVLSWQPCCLGSRNRNLQQRTQPSGNTFTWVDLLQTPCTCSYQDVFWPGRETRCHQGEEAAGGVRAPGSRSLRRRLLCTITSTRMMLFSKHMKRKGEGLFLVSYVFKTRGLLRQTLFWTLSSFLPSGAKFDIPLHNH